MAASGARIRELQQIPVLALREVMYRLLEDEKTEQILRKRFGHVLSRRLQHMRRAVQRMGREQLTSLVDACPEIGDEQVHQMFEAFRYGSNPSFYVYLFDKAVLGRDALQGFRQRLEDQMAAFSATRESGLSHMRRLALGDLVSLPEKPGVVEGIYRFETRMDYVDETQNAASAYETLYGFFWLNPAEGYAIIHGRSADVLKALRTAIERAVSIQLAPLVISKQLRNALPFLLRDSMRVGRLHDPDPGPGRFRWLTVADENPYAKGYQDLEERYPEVRSLRYREMIGDDRETTLTIRCDRGALSLAGTLSASQLRAWTLDRLGQLISVLNEFRPSAAAYVQTPDLEDVAGLVQFSRPQRRQIGRIISALLTVKQAPLLGYQRLGVSALDLAADMGSLLKLQVPAECPGSSEEAGGYLACPICSATTFDVKAQNGTWELVCRGHKRQRWATSLPVVGESAGQEHFALDEEDVAATAELLPSEPLLEAVADVINRYLPGYTFDLRRESFIVRGANLVYYPDKSKVRDSDLNGAKTVIYVNQHIGSIQGGEVVGVQPEPALVASAFPPDAPAPRPDES